MVETILTGGTIYAEQATRSAAAVVVQDATIKKIIDRIDLQQNPTQQIFAFPAGYHIIPGFIDLHVHGAQGHDVMDADEAGLHAIRRALAAEGTTAFLATTMTADALQTEKALTTVQQVMQATAQSGATILGLHLEGPFLSPAKKGAQAGQNILLPDVALMQRWQALAVDNVRLVTLAPEQPGSSELISYLRQQNIICSLGHTNATYAEATAAIQQGCTHATHLFNAMTGIQHREPGTVTAALLADTMMVELIVDGIHLHPAIVELVLKIKGKEKIILVTDSMRAKCLQDGCYELGGQEVIVKNNSARLADGTLAGSVLRMNSAIQNLLTFTGCELEDAVLMGSSNPAKTLGIFARKGSLAPGKDADIVVLDEKLNVQLTMCNGKITYQAQTLLPQEG